jgi:hypothetical protein
MKPLNNKTSQSKNNNNRLAQNFDALVKRQSKIIVQSLCVQAFSKLRQN